MKGINALILIFLSFSIIGCSENLSKKLDADCETEQSKELENIDKIFIYRIAPVYTVAEEPWLLTEEEIRNDCDYDIVVCSYVKEYFAYLLFNSKPIKLGNVPTKACCKGFETLLDGMVIDIAYYDGTVRTFVMKNDGLKIFYEKGLEGIYYKMPKQLLEKFYIEIKD